MNCHDIIVIFESREVPTRLGPRQADTWTKIKSDLSALPTWTMLR